MARCATGDLKIRRCNRLLHLDYCNHQLDGNGSPQKRAVWGDFQGNDADLYARRWWNHLQRMSPNVEKSCHHAIPAGRMMIPIRVDGNVAEMAKVTCSAHQK